MIFFMAMDQSKVVQIVELKVGLVKGIFSKINLRGGLIVNMYLE